MGLFTQQEESPAVSFQPGAFRKTPASGIGQEGEFNGYKV
jgi:hypothetical protein